MTEAPPLTFAKTNEFWSRRIIMSILLLAPVVLLLGIFFVFPIVGILIRSFTVTETQLGVENYISLVQSTAFRNVFRITFEVALYTTLVCLVLGFPLAYWLTTLRKRIAEGLLFVTLIPFWTAILARLYAWTVILGRRGILNEFLQAAELTQGSLNLLFNLPSVVIGMTHLMLPYMILILYSTLSDIDMTLIDASRSLGAGSLQTVRRVYLPLASPGIYAGSLLVFIVSLGFFVTPAVLGGGRVTTISIFIGQQVQILNWGVASAMSIALLVVTSLLFLIFNRFFGVEQLLTGGIRK